MSAASGLWRIGHDERDPLRASTAGTGMMMRDAMARGAREMLLGIGGSATNDGGIGMAAALGYRFLGEGWEGSGGDSGESGAVPGDQGVGGEFSKGDRGVRRE